MKEGPVNPKKNLKIEDGGLCAIAFGKDEFFVAGDGGSVHRVAQMEEGLVLKESVLSSTCGITGLQIMPSGDLAALSIDQRIALFSTKSSKLLFKSATLTFVADASDFALILESSKFITVG